MATTDNPSYADNVLPMIPYGQFFCYPDEFHLWHFPSAGQHRQFKYRQRDLTSVDTLPGSICGYFISN